ncbi:MAG: NAD(P)H-dependent oxidoreductase [Nanoarchaeota archaeon]
MKYLIIYAHPDTDGHCKYILEQTKKRLKHFDNEIHIMDLYKMAYDPVLHESEHYTAGNTEISHRNQKIQEYIAKSDHLVFIYPVWWSSMPAILKGFLDRTLTPGFAFRYVKGVPRGLLSAHATILATTGAPTILNWLSLRLPLKLIRFAILRFCGIKSKGYLISNARDLTEKQKRKIDRIVKKAFR